MIAQDVENQQKRESKCINTFEVMKVLDQNAQFYKMQTENPIGEPNLSAPSVTKCARGFSTVQTKQFRYTQKVAKCTFCG